MSKILVFGVSLAVSLAAVPPVVTANDGENFTFKRVKVPKRGTRKRITIQVGVPDKPAVKTPTRPSRTPTYAWFWNDVSSVIQGTPSTRMRIALEALEAADKRGVVLYGSDSLVRRIAANHGQEIVAAATRNNLSPAFILSVIAVESRGNANATSPKGARGLMQLMPATAARMGVKNSADPAQNLLGGARYLKGLLSLFSNDAILSLAGYNAGENAVLKHFGVPPYKETRAYVPKVLSAWRHARLLCVEPPQSPLDSCQLRVVATGVAPSAPDRPVARIVPKPTNTEPTPSTSPASIPAPTLPDPASVPVIKSVPLDG